MDIDNTKAYIDSVELYLNSTKAYIYSVEMEIIYIILKLTLIQESWI